MSDDLKHIILANMNVKLYSWPLTFCKVVQQQIWGEVVVLIPSFSADPFLI